MNIAAVDLNLLVAFEALYDTRNVTLAGLRLGRAQSSVSNTLGRLRVLFKDELFVRTASGMMPTDRAVALMPAITEALGAVRHALETTLPFDPAQAAGRRFTVAASDYADIVLIPHLMARLRRLAPAVDVRITRLDRAAVYGQIDRGEVDAAIGGHLAVPKRMQATRLYAEQFVCMTAPDHPLLQGRTLDLATYLALPHALFVPSDDGTGRGVLDTHLARLGHRRRVAATFSHIVALPYAVRHTDLIATLAAGAARPLAQAVGATIHPLPPELVLPPFDITLVTGRRASGNAALAWLCTQVIEAVGLAPHGVSRR